jgi:branched-chain amino acid transport system ATP-binding protein
VTEAAPAVEHAEPTLRLRGVGRRFGGLLAVTEVDLDVVQGERRAILGPNGAGKTTLFNVICGDIPASTGTVEIFGEDVTKKPARYRAKMGLARTYQQSRLFDGLTVEDSIYLAIVGVEGGRLRPVLLPGKEREIRERAREAAGRVAISRKLGEIVGSLSHGEHRQVAIAMALAAEPKALLLLGLDREITLILIEHDMDIALRVAESVTMMHDGRVIVEGTPDEIRANETVHDLYLGRGYGHE